ncbi:hypothetical protein V492_06771, partial [Pseudogymnoascus sp. VKM F-4246]
DTEKDSRRRDALLAESQSKLQEMTRERDQLTENVTTLSADFNRLHDQAESRYLSLDSSHREALDVIEKTRVALHAETEKSQKLEEQISLLENAAQRRAEEELSLQQRQTVLGEREEELRVDSTAFKEERSRTLAKLYDDQAALKKGQDKLASDRASFRGKVSANEKNFKARVDEFKENEAKARNKVQTLYDKLRADEEAIERTKLELATAERYILADIKDITAREETVKDRSIGLRDEDERLRQRTRELNIATKSHEKKKAEDEIAAKNNEKLMKDALQKRDVAEEKVHEAIARLAVAETKMHEASTSLTTSHGEHIAAIAEKDAIIAGLTETNALLTVAVASLSRDKDSLAMRPPPPPSTPFNPRLPSPQSNHSAISVEAVAVPSRQDFQFLTGGSSRKPTTTPDGPEEVVAQINSLKEAWLGFFKPAKMTPLAWAQPGTKPSCVNRRARRYTLNLNGGHEGGEDPVSACRKCRFDKLPCIISYKDAAFPVVLPLAAMFRKGKQPTDKGYWVLS